MKINIIGPSGSGKSTLAKRLSEEFNLPHHNLDQILFEPLKDRKGIKEVPEDQWKKRLNTIIKTDNWIIEGINPIEEVFDKADEIIFLKPHLLTSLFRQWKRYFTDPIQRKEHGFRNNLKLSKFIIRQYREKEDLQRQKDPKYFRVKKVERLLTKYIEKVSK